MAKTLVKKEGHRQPLPLVKSVSSSISTAGSLLCSKEKSSWNDSGYQKNMLNAVCYRSIIVSLLVFPAALHDAISSIFILLIHPDREKYDPSQEYMFSGDSAGGILA
jgi:hypothetical protein